MLLSAVSVLVVAQSSSEVPEHIIYVWIQNYNARKCLSFGCEGKATTATGNVNTFKIISQQ